MLFSLDSVKAMVHGIAFGGGALPADKGGYFPPRRALDEIDVFREVVIASGGQPTEELRFFPTLEIRVSRSIPLPPLPHAGEVGLGHIRPPDFPGSGDPLIRTGGALQFADGEHEGHAGVLPGLFGELL